MEIQFYLVAPFLVFTMSMFVPPIRVLIVFIVAIFSYYHQSSSAGNEEHMALLSRVWQFMIGFMSGFLSQSRLLYFEQWLKDNKYSDYESLRFTYCVGSHPYV